MRTRSATISASPRSCVTWIAVDADLREHGPQVDGEPVVELAVERSERLVEQQEPGSAAPAPGPAPRASPRRRTASRPPAARTRAAGPGRAARSPALELRPSVVRPSASPKPTLAPTSRCGNSWSSWKTKPNRRRWVGTSSQSSPSQRTDPRPAGAARRSPAAGCSCPSRSGRGARRPRSTHDEIDAWSSTVRRSESDGHVPTAEHRHHGGARPVDDRRRARRRG